jgi:hypothetical protein
VDVGLLLNANVQVQLYYGVFKTAIQPPISWFLCPAFNFFFDGFGGQKEYFTYKLLAIDLPIEDTQTARQAPREVWG